MNIFRRFANWVRDDYPGPQGSHIALLALCATRTIEVRKDDDDSVWIGWKGQDRGQWVRLS